MKLKIVFTAFMALVFTSCEKAGRETACAEIFKEDYLRFRIADKATGADLFFSGSPQHAIEDLKMQFEDRDVEISVKKYADGSKYFSVGTSYIFAKAGNVALKIGSQPARSLSYNLKPDADVCPQYIFDKISFNGITEANVSGRVVVLMW